MNLQFSSSEPLSLHCLRRFQPARRAGALWNCGNRLDILTLDTTLSHTRKLEKLKTFCVQDISINKCSIYCSIYVQCMFTSATVKSIPAAKSNCPAFCIGKFLTKLIVDAGERDDEIGAFPNFRPWGYKVQVSCCQVCQTPLNLHARPPRPLSKNLTCFCVQFMPYQYSWIFCDLLQSLDSNTFQLWRRQWDHIQIR